MQSRIEKSALVGSEVILGLTGLASSVALIAGWRFPLDWLPATEPLVVFGRVPLLLVTLLLGGSALVAVWLLWHEHRLGIFVAAASGVGILSYQLVVMVEGPFSWAQLVYAGLGTVILVLSGSLTPAVPSSSTRARRTTTSEYGGHIAPHTPDSDRRESAKAA
jgi:hypothetical protein